MEFTRMKTAAHDEAYGVINMIQDKRRQFDICLFDSETEATTWSLGNME